MGGIRRRKKHAGHGGKDKNGKKKREAGQPGNYKDIVRENEMYAKFFGKQKLCADEKELALMVDTMKTDLPASFRVTGFRSQATAVRNVIEGTYFKELADIAAGTGTEIKTEGGGDEQQPTNVVPKCLEWYPDRMAWQINLTRREIRRVESYFRLHNFLISETESGNISRQETVSMIPPRVLDVRPHHKVLDMCAAPGSKTAQIIEALHSEEGSIPSGLVVANDSDNSRCYMLVHQAKRLQSPNYIIVNHDASCMPNLQYEKEDGSVGNLRYDRVLCDVPCSGDGTLRKNADIWPKWNPLNSTNLHGIQYRIARRGLELLEVGGRMVYSTCALHPVEDEAVIARILRDTEGTVKLVDASAMVPGLKYKRGLNEWHLATKDCSQFFSQYSEVPESMQSIMRPYMFPPTEEEAATFNLDRCMRVLPHMQNTGGFFVAVLEKSAPCPWENKKKYEEEGEGEGKPGEADEKNGEGRKRKADDGGVGGGQRPKKALKFHGYKEDPFVYFDAATPDPAFTEIKEYFGLEGIDQSMLLTRCRDASKRNNLYFTSKLVRNVVESNKDREAVKIVNTGVKAFCKAENKGALCPFRLSQDGSMVTIPFLKKRIVRPTAADLDLLLSTNDVEPPKQLEEMDEETQRQLAELDTGSVALVYETKGEDEKTLRINLVGWKGKASLRAYVPKNERVHYLRLIGADTSKFEVNKFQVKRDEEERQKAEEGKEEDVEVKPEVNAEVKPEVEADNGDKE